MNGKYEEAFGVCHCLLSCRDLSDYRRALVSILAAATLQDLQEERADEIERLVKEGLESLATAHRLYAFTLTKADVEEREHWESFAEEILEKIEAGKARRKDDKTKGIDSAQESNISGVEKDTVKPTNMLDADNESLQIPERQLARTGSIRETENSKPEEWDAKAIDRFFGDEETLPKLKSQWQSMQSNSAGEAEANEGADDIADTTDLREDVYNTPQCLKFPARPLTPEGQLLPGISTHKEVGDGFGAVNGIWDYPELPSPPILPLMSNLAGQAEVDEDDEDIAEVVDVMEKTKEFIARTVDNIGKNVDDMAMAVDDIGITKGRIWQALRNMQELVEDLAIPVGARWRRQQDATTPEKVGVKAYSLSTGDTLHCHQEGFRTRERTAATDTSLLSPMQGKESKAQATKAFMYHTPGPGAECGYPQWAIDFSGELVRMPNLYRRL
ncbi:uncharacterized protein AB675_11169 [Cyphellophora attinorum]|uniref:Uncharacterized protein n=1 Tax=Cyphellophora attinorum TaxID=1664694 RepID=A0A0N1HMA8_9EURO|nr:uncharacterized protein AB675_11169 [Phialophora attinorum]KPI35860.1 hypothetical protein AB675_11169 [Phialophora attinorum]